MLSFPTCLVFVTLFGIVCGQVSISGLSSGAYAAVQYHVAYSSELVGAGIIAGGPYWCAMDNVAVALTSCMTLPNEIDIDVLTAATQYAFLIDTIDDPSNLQNQKVWLYSGTEDSVVVPGVMKKLADYYASYVNTANIATVFNVSSAHSFVTDDWGHDCEYFGTPYINNCQYDSAGALLQHIYGTLAPKVANASADNIMTLDQSSFIPAFYTTETAALQNTAYLYVPSDKCKSSPCKLHISLHGCQQTLQDINTTYVEHVGLNAWAESNNILVLYPQAMKTILNPEGCWDWWGYTGLDYATNLAAQMVTINGMANYIKTKFNVA